MANTLPGTPYVESSDLVANYPAVSESLAERVDLVGILPFANSTARGTALPTPTDGQYSYLQDTNSTEFWDGAAWVPAGVTPGLRIVAPTSIANSGGSASASGGQVTFTGVSSVSLNGLFTSAYANYFIACDVTQSTAAILYMRLRVSGTDNTTTNYWARYVAIPFNTAAVAGTGNTNNENAWNLETMGTGSRPRILQITNPQASQHTTAQVFGTNGTTWPFVGGALFNDTTQFDGLTIYPNTGNITGTIRVYGYQNS